ncbi:MAG: STAS domain-containing protein [Candidatus Muiribacteriota bacterium]|jgi:anti-anti-sigma factor
MNIDHKIDENNDLIIVFPIGSYDVEDTGFFENEIKTLLESSGKKKIIFNMNQLIYLNSTALNQFVGLYNKLLKSGHKIAFCSLTKPVETLFNITSLQLLVPIFPSEWDATNFLSK